MISADEMNCNLFCMDSKWMVLVNTIGILSVFINLVIILHTHFERRIAKQYHSINPVLVIKWFQSVTLGSMRDDGDDDDVNNKNTDDKNDDNGNNSIDYALKLGLSKKWTEWIVRGSEREGEKKARSMAFC